MSSRYHQAMAQLQDVAVRGYNKTGNVGGRSNIRDSGLNLDHFQIGIVVRSGAGAFDAQVRIGRKHPIPCIQLGGLNAYSSAFGYTASKLVQEGSAVLVYKPQAFSDFGIIISELPIMYGGKPEQEQASAVMIDPEPSVAVFTEKSYRDPLTDPKYWGIMNANAGKALDLFPGELAWSNEMGAGLALLHMCVSMRSGERAKLEMFCLDDLVRMVSGQYQHFSSLGEQHIYNDYGYVTEERVGSLHHCEVMALPAYDTNTAVKVQADLDKAKECCWKAKQPGMIPHRRFHTFMGHLGGLYQFFATSPAEDDPSKYGDMKDKGLAHIAVDDCGRIMVRSVSDIVLQRTDTIALPRKNKEPWDPEGDKVEDDDPFKEKKPFKWDKPDKDASHPLQERDYFAWARKLTYQRFWEVSDLNGKKDWILKEEADAPKPADNYDTILKNEEEYTRWEERSVTVSLRKDGGLTARNDKGAEISLCGEDIIITCPGNIMLRAGKHIIGLAKDDLVLKAVNSIDLTATNKDVRVKAEKNLHQLAGRSMLLEVGEPDNEKPMGLGENASLPEGVIIRAPKGSILAWAENIQLSVLKDMIIEGVKSKAAKMIVALKQLITVTEDTMLIAKGSGDAAGLALQGGAAHVFGASANLIGKSSANVIRSGEVGIFVDWVRAGSNPYAQVSNVAKDAKKAYLDKDDWQGMFKEKTRKKMAFSYRTESDYNIQDMEIYESHWAFVGRKSGSPPPTWDDPEIRKTRPWPGEQPYKSPTLFYELDKEENIEDVKKGTPKKFDQRQPKGGSFNQKKFSEYRG